MNRQTTHQKLERSNKALAYAIHHGNCWRMRNLYGTKLPKRGFTKPLHPAHIKRLNTQARIAKITRV